VAGIEGGRGMALHAFDGTWNEAHDTGVYGVNANVVEFERESLGCS
jgi:hypothetical protein